MKKTITGIIVLLLIVPLLVKAQQDVTLRIQPVIDVAVDPPPNFVIENPPDVPIFRYYYNVYSQLIGINNYFYITNIGGPGIISVEINAGEYTENKQFTVEASTNYTLVSSVPVWVGAGTGSVFISAPLPGADLSRIINGLTATGVSASTLDTGFEGRDWYWYDRYDYEAWDYENIAFENNIFTAVGYKGKIITSSDGQNWAIKNSGTTEDLSGVAYGNSLWVATAWDNLIYTSENTETWTERLNVAEWFSGAAYGSGRYVAVGGAIYTSVDGITWSKTGTGSYNFSGIGYMNNTFIAVGDGIYTSAAGTSWTQVLPRPSGTHLSGIAYGNGVYVSVGWIWDSGSRGDGIVYTSSNGSDWTQQTLNVTGIVGLDKVAFGDEYFIAVGDDGAIIESTDGVTWTLVPSGTTNQLTGIAFADGLFVVVGHGAGSLINYTVTHISNKSTNLPANFVLYQNYPNPFNPSTTIDFSIPQRAFVTLKIHSILGETVAVLVSEELSAGHYGFLLDASSLPSGVYFYRLETKGSIETKKLILLK